MPEAVENGLELLRFGGRMVMAGSTFPSRAVALPAEQVVRRMLQLTGVYNYQPEDLASALEFLASEVERYPFASLVGREFSLDEVQVAFDYSETVRPPRVAIVPAGI